MSTLFFLVGLASTSQLGMHFWPSWSFPLGIPSDYLSPTIYLSDLLLVVFLLANLTKFLKLLKNNQHYVFASALFASINVVYAINPLLSLISWLRLLLLITLALIITSSSKKHLNILINGLTVATITASLVAIVQFILQKSIGGPLYLLGERSLNISTPGIAKFDRLGLYFLRPYSTFSHPNSLAGFLVVSIFILLSFKKTIPSKFLQITIPLAIFAILITFSRNALFTLILSVIISQIPLLYKNIKKILTLTPLFTLPLLLLNHFQFTKTKEITERLFLNGLSLQTITNHPFSGVGLGNYLISQSTLVNPLSLKNFTLLNQPVHNIYLLLASEIGLPILFATLILLSKKINSSKQLLIALFAVLITGLFDHYWLTLVQNRLLLAILLGLIFNKSSRKIVS